MSLLESTVAELNTQKGEMTETLDELRAKLDQLDWVGADRDAYEEKKASWDTSFGRLITILEGVASAGQLAREKYQEAEESYVEVLSRDRRATSAANASRHDSRNPTTRKAASTEAMPAAQGICWNCHGCGPLIT